PSGSRSRRRSPRTSRAPSEAARPSPRPSRRSTATWTTSSRSAAGSWRARRPAVAADTPRHEVRAAWMFLAPGLFAITVLFLIPIGAALLLSLTDFDIYSLGNIAHTRFVGLRNYTNLLADPLLWKAMRNTALFLFVG